MSVLNLPLLIRGSRKVSSRNTQVDENSCGPIADGSNLPQQNADILSNFLLNSISRPVASRVKNQTRRRRSENMKKSKLSSDCSEL